MSGEYIPDPVELSERRIDRYLDTMEGDNIRCVNCGKMVPIDSVVMMSPDPDGPPVCEACADIIDGDQP
jgi:hypothetical protein